jgi:CRP/FNR family transcriptional regulator
VDLIENHPSVALNMLAVLSKRLRKFAGLIEDLSLKEVPGRLAAYLLLLSEQKKGAIEFDLDVSKNQLASLLGTIPETLSRILARMEKEKLIKSEGKRFTLVNRKGLTELSDGEQKLP